MKAPLKALSAALIAAAGVLTPAASRADFAYAVTFVDNDLISVDTATGNAALIAPLGQTVNPFGLAAVNGQLFTFDSVADTVDQIDPGSGAITKAVNIGIGPVLGQGGLAFQTNTTGFLTSTLDPAPPNNPMNNLYRFDIAAGTSSLVGQTSAPIEALAFGPNGTLYGLGKLDGNLYSINPTTAATTLIGSTGVSVGGPTGSLALASDGTLYATLDDKLYTLNRSNGAATAVGTPFDPATDTGTGFASISGLALTVSPIPEPSSLVLTGLGVVGACAVFRRGKTGGRRSS